MQSVPERSRKHDRRTRYEQYGEGHPYCQMPGIDGFEWLASVFQECGIAGQGMSGPVPLTWQEIDAYDRITRGVYTSWSLGLVREMSDAYVRWHNKGSQQKDLADDVPYIERNEETLSAARDTIMRNRDKSQQLQSEALNG